jgi:hypothetical protein
MNESNQSLKKGRDICDFSQSGLAQLVRFLVVELIYPGLNPRFDMSVAFTANYFFSGKRCLRRQ